MSETDSLVHGLVRIHLVISRAIDMARQRARAYADGEPVDASTSAGFADYLQALVSVLHGHHTGEDAIAFPALRDRFPDAPWQLLSDEHAAVVPVLAALEGLMPRLRHQPERETWAAVAQALDGLNQLWEPHYRREETQFSVPLVAGAVPAEEQAALVAQLAAHSQQHSQPDFLVVPFLLYNLEGEERRAMGTLFPPVVTEQLVPMVWREKWAPMKPFLLA